MANVSRTTKAGKDVAIVAALRKGVLGLDQIPLAGKVYTQSGAADLVQGRIDAGAAVLKAKAEWEAAIAAYEAIDAQVDVAVRDLRNVVIGACGEDSPKMATFEFVPRKKRVFTQEQITAIVAKRNATRVRRGTKGRRQKMAIKGVVPNEAEAAAQVGAATAPTAASAAATAGEPVAGASPAVVLAVAGATPAGSQAIGPTQGVTLAGNVGSVAAAPPGEPGNTSG
jgi:hypothetical protein